MRTFLLWSDTEPEKQFPPERRRSRLEPVATPRRPGGPAEASCLCRTRLGAEGPGLGMG
jgi:hypothetical protein